MGSRITITKAGYWDAMHGNNGQRVEFKNGPKAAMVTEATVPATRVATYPGLLRTAAPVSSSSVTLNTARRTQGAIETKLLRILAEGGWSTLAKLAKRAHLSKDSVSSSLRRMRTAEYGSHNIVAHKGEDRKWRYANMAYPTGMAMAA